MCPHSHSCPCAVPHTITVTPPCMGTIVLTSCAHSLPCPCLCATSCAHGPHPHPYPCHPPHAVLPPCPHSCTTSHACMHPSRALLHVHCHPHTTSCVCKVM